MKRRRRERPTSLLQRDEADVGGVEDLCSVGAHSPQLRCWVQHQHPALAIGGAHLLEQEQAQRLGNDIW